MLEFLLAYSSEIVVSTTIVIVQLIKGFSFLSKVSTRLISILVSTILIALLHYVVVPEQTYTVVEAMIVVILPSLGYDRVLEPIGATILKFWEALVKPKV